MELSNLRSGELKNCFKCRFTKKNRNCDLPFDQSIEKSEEKKGKCVYFVEIINRRSMA